MGEISTANAEITPISDLYNMYVKYIDASPRTVQEYTKNLRQWARYLDKNSIKRPERQDVIKYREELKERCKPATVQAYMVAIRLFYKWTSQAGLYPNIAENVKGAKRDTTHKRDYLTVKQIRKIISMIDTRSERGKRDYAIILLMVTGGLRDIEVARADIRDMQDISAGLVLFLHGKGRDGKEDYIKIVPEVKDAINDYLQIRKDWSNYNALFVSTSNHNKGQRLTTRSISKIVKHRMLDAGISSERLTAHSLRHTAITLSLKGGLPLGEVQQFARHKSVSTTMIYSHEIEREYNRSEAIIANSIFNADQEGSMP